ncbi:DUF983 domain-containing protein [uncultured Tenacibaculum sp.]|uniref:DUF983 domain-containing protein n=1 Tax=uncultured Tenacibaculum sp. TaxID=174713 RepID=UPI00262FAC1B|nr:DUF983 domain-containing protein [uncultured Tenacibaculum sp.]
MRAFKLLKKGSKLYSIVNHKCPRCHEGDFFTHKLNFNPKKVIKQNETCSHCNLKYAIEPSFFFGAMYVSYAINVAIIVTTFIICKVFLDVTIIQSFIAIIITAAILTPLTLRLSRIIWINIFVNYEKKIK